MDNNVILLVLLALVVFCFMIVNNNIKTVAKDKFAATIACHFSIRAGKSLVGEEISFLIESLEKCDNPNMCPHGRPTMLKLSLNHIESHFGRT